MTRISKHARWPASALLATVCIANAEEHHPTTTDFTPAVDPLIGVTGGGNTLPGPYLPFGMVRIGPDCGELNTNSGYGEGPVVGFSHVHVSGTGGGSKYGNVLFRPITGDLDLNKPAGNSMSETASIGLNESMLDSGIRVELGATRRAGFHRYTFPKDKQSHVVLDLGSILSRGEAITARCIN